MNNHEHKETTQFTGLLRSGNEQFKGFFDKDLKLTKEQKIFVYFALVVLAVFLIFQIIEFIVFVWAIMQ